MTHNGFLIYSGCDIDHPKSFFDDCTVQVDTIWEDIKTLNIARLLDVIDPTSNRHSVIHNVMPYVL